MFATQATNKLKITCLRQPKETDKNCGGIIPFASRPRQKYLAIVDGKIKQQKINKNKRFIIYWVFKAYKYTKAYIQPCKYYTTTLTTTLQLLSFLTQKTIDWVRYDYIRMRWKPVCTGDMSTFGRSIFLSLRAHTICSIDARR
jgi:hypothetical protein